MRFKIYAILILYILIQQKVSAQNPVYQFSHLDITDGLSINQVSSIYKDSKGFMWFGTIAGLNRYDGYKFKVFKHSANDPNSLSDNTVVAIFEGPERKLWIKTNSGLCVYNPVTEKFSNVIVYELTKYNVLTDQITTIRKDKEGNFWFLTNDRGLYCYHPKNNSTTFFSSAANSSVKLHSNIVTDVVEDSHGLFWLIYSDGVIDQFDIHKNKIISSADILAKANNKRYEVYSGTFDNNSNLWICAAGSPIGVYRYHTNTGTLDHFNTESADIKLNYNVINNIILSDDNKIWIGTDHGGINLYDPVSNSIQYLLNREDDAKSLKGNTVELYKDNTGIIWAGTFKQGVSYYHKSIIQFPLVRKFLSDNKSLPFEDVDCFADDANGNLWIGTNGGGLINYNSVTKKYTQFKHNPNDPNSLTNDVVIRLCIDHEHKLWIGTYFGGLDCFDGNKFTHYRHNDNIPSSISDDRVYTIIEDSSNKLWVGTFAGSTNIFNRETNSFLHPNYQMLSNYTAVIYEDKQKNIWIGRDKGLDFIEKGKNKAKHYFNQPKNPNSLVANDVNCIIEDREGLFWIGTKDGLSVLNARTNEFHNLDEAKGLPGNNVLNVLEDNDGSIWISTKNGLARINYTKTGDDYKFQINKFDEFDGLQGKEFNACAAFKTKKGLMIFGGAHGFNIFDPKSINIVKSKPQLLFTDFQLFNKSVAAGDTVNGNVVLKSSITDTRDLTLTHNENDFSIEFADCDYFNPDKIVYQYKLDGFDKQWLSAPNDIRKATYTNLDAGDYVFKVRASNINDPKNSGTITLNIKVLPPFWKSPIAYALYFLSVICLLFYIRHKGILKLKREFKIKQDKLESERKIAQEREEARRMHELDLMKIKFFTNVSHEFRTPLSLIISPIDNLIKSNEDAGQKHHLMMIKRNGRRLLNLVNQLLDFRKMEFKELKLNLSKGDIIQFIKEVSSSFTDIADQNHVDYLIESDVESVIIKFDRDKIERVLFNLLSNAFKFTASGGNVSIFISLVKENAAADEQQLLEIKVIDTGIGIPKEIHDKVFERFFQDNMPESLLNQGSGIGLSITREFVKMHGGEISIESEPGNGTCFTVQLPVDLEYEKSALVPEQPAVVKQEESSRMTSKKPVILLIEDNDDLRFYLKDNLKHNFNIVEAINGKDGWQKALALHPNLIVSDVSMPEMNGIDLCKKIKGDKRTEHIPIILLTALTDEENQLAGLTNGANDYISKPFNFQILLSKINGLLLMQKTLKKTYQKQVEVNAQDIAVVSEDERFLKNVFSCIENNITNPNFSVEELSRHLSLSRISLYKRMLSLTGKTPVDCIRTIRLKRAVQLLEKSKLNIAGVAYESGFNNPNYFSKVFKDEYGMLPSEYVTEMRKKEKEILEEVD
ncbi:two-component regulator propeller domain-containing protein [Mucilaginibacter sp.]|uniref:hybrid sensor histidine kinase/response regulator transcription factor n=1 Tax=Mucilaginibacter sp. TaxID=1882438 RepID=UPI00283EFEDD|nr:two-component regulator propeller domain-containing protein [Mucilaginibacter sp.]MDR3696251.1 two-component regulator propeller domain-containing protein [Mucilaginibacter sp.]